MTFGIWIPSQDNPQITWETFKTTLSGWGNLSWIVEEPSNPKNYKQ